MTAYPELPLPRLAARTFASLKALTDDALFARLRVRIAFTERAGGVSAGPYHALNLGGHVGDDAEAVAINRARVAAAFGAPDLPIVPTQVHGDALVCVDDASTKAIASARASAEEGADGIIVTVPNVAALLCFADCVPVVLVAPSGRFAVVHAGWRGVMNGVAAKAVRKLASREAEACAIAPKTAIASLNVYVGPHIRACCFETSADVRKGFTDRFGAACAPDGAHVDLFCALSGDLQAAGIDVSRIADAGVCTVCDHERWFSYRASGGTCGRHGAFAVRTEE